MRIYTVGMYIAALAIFGFCDALLSAWISGPARLAAMAMLVIACVMFGMILDGWSRTNK